MKPVKLIAYTTFSAVLMLVLSTGCNTMNGGKGQTALEDKEWEDFGGGPDHSKYVNLKQMTKENINQLEVAFVYPSSDNVGYRFNPVIADGVMYVLAKNNSLVAIDATTGKEIWIHANLRGITNVKGINFWQSKDKKQKRLLFVLGNALQAIDANTGKSIMDFGENGYTDLKLGLGRDASLIGRGASTHPGHIYEDLILYGSAPGENPFSGPGDLRAYSVITGKLVWVFHTIPLPGEYGYDTWPKDAYKYVGGANTWGEMSVDEKRGIAYFPTGSPTYDYDGSDRPGMNLFGNCLIALDARTGKRLWHFQTVHHDLWDYDLVAAPQLITVNHKGKKIDAVAQAGKNGFLYVFNRVTGEPLWPIEERPVPKSEMANEQSWPTQPFPTVVPPFNRHVVTAEDLNPYVSDRQKETWTKRLQTARAGIYQPLSDKYEVIAIPGSVGGANYGNTASNPAKGIVYVQTQENTNFYNLVLRAPAGGGNRGGGGGGNAAGAVSAERLAKAGALYTQTCQPCHGADKAGVTGAGPTLANLRTTVNAEAFKGVIANGKGRMPALPHISETDIADLYAYLAPAPAGGRGGGGGGQNAAATPALPEGPVVASGGVQAAAGGRPTLNYPEGYTGAKSLYKEKNDWGEAANNILTPPWTSIVAYDLNTGAIKWKVPLGNDDKIPNSKNLGIPGGSQGKGMVVTSTGLLFSTCLDGRLYVYDAENGNILKTIDLGRNNPGGIPAMYEANGRQYLVVCSTGSLKDRTKQEVDVPKGYIVYALPQKK